MKIDVCIEQWKEGTTREHRIHSVVSMIIPWYSLKIGLVLAESKNNQNRRSEGVYLHALRILPEKVQRCLHPCSENTRNANGGLARVGILGRRYRPAQSIYPWCSPTSIIDLDVHKICEILTKPPSFPKRINIYHRVGSLSIWTKIPQYSHRVLSHRT